MKFTLLLILTGFVLAGYFVFNGLSEISTITKDNVQSFHEKDARRAIVNELSQ